MVDASQPKTKVMDFGGNQRFGREGHSKEKPKKNMFSWEGGKGVN